MALKCCVIKIIRLVLSIRDQPLIIFSVGVFLQSEDVFAEGFTNCLELRFIELMMNGFELILEDGLEVGTSKGDKNGMTLGFTVGEMLSTRLGEKDLLSM